MDRMAGRRQIEFTAEEINEISEEKLELGPDGKMKTVTKFTMRTGGEQKNLYTRAVYKKLQELTAPGTRFNINGYKNCGTQKRAIYLNCCHNKRSALSYYKNEHNLNQPLTLYWNHDCSLCFPENQVYSVPSLSQLMQKQESSASQICFVSSAEHTPSKSNEQVNRVNNYQPPQKKRKENEHVALLFDHVLENVTTFIRGTKLAFLEGNLDQLTVYDQRAELGLQLQSVFLDSFNNFRSMMDGINSNDTANLQNDSDDDNSVC